MKTKLALALIVLFTVFSAVAQYLYKIGSARLELDLVSIITNYHIILGVFFYGLGAILVLFAMKKLALSVAYPFFALSYIWVAFISVFILNELLQLVNWLGLIFITIGISLVGYGAEHG